MRILYGVVGEGMGHATRSRVVIDHLLESGHEILVAVSGRAHQFLVSRYRNRGGVRIEEIHGLRLVTDADGVDISETLWSTLKDAPRAIQRNVEAYRKLADPFAPEVVISDFESWAYFYGRFAGVPVISLDNMQVLNRCAHDDVLAEKTSAFRLAKFVVKAKLPGAYHYLVTSFFAPKVRKPRTTLVPPIVRDEVVRADRRAAPHVLVYQTASATRPLVPMLQHFEDQTFRVYGAGREEGEDGNVLFRPFSERGFLNDLRTAKAVIATAGFTLMSECVVLSIPMLAIPIEGQAEQELNALWLEHLGYGARADKLTDDVIRDFLGDLDRYNRGLEHSPEAGNRMTFNCLDELLRDISLDEPPKDALESDALGKYDPVEIDA